MSCIVSSLGSTVNFYLPIYVIPNRDLAIGISDPLRSSLQGSLVFETCTYV